MSKKYSYSLDKNASKVHKSVVKFFKEKLPKWQISQNHSIKIDDKTLYADIYCTSPVNFIIEINGEQHYNFTPHFHHNQEGFKTAQLNDQIKRNWAEMNDFKMIEVRAKNFKIEDFHNLLMQKLREEDGE